MRAAEEVVRRINHQPGRVHDCLHEGYSFSLEAIGGNDLDAEEGLNLPRTVLDLILHGRTLAGTSIWPKIRKPSPEELREEAVYFVFWIPERPPRLHNTSVETECSYRKSRNPVSRAYDARQTNGLRKEK